MKLIFYILCFSLAFQINAQVICKETKTLIQLRNGNTVHIYKERNSKNSPIYYYVPNQLKLVKKNGKPGYSFLDYKNANNTTTDGAIFHMLVTWGLNKKELQELKLKIKSKYGGKASLAGAVYLDNIRSRISFSTHTNVGKILSQSLKSKGAPPTHASGKMALSFRFKKHQVNIVKQALKTPSKLKGTNMSINYTYKTNTCKQGLSVAQNTSTVLKGKLQNWF